MSTAFRIWLVSLIQTALFAWISVSWLDRPIALWVHEVFGRQQIPAELSEAPILSPSLIAALLFVACGIAAMMGRRFSKAETTVLMCVMSTLAAIVVKDQLKFVFGRTWPESWGPGILSLVQNNVYGFHFFHAGKAFKSFPSGHAAVAAASLSVIYMLWNKLRVFSAACMVAIDVGLILLNLHFLSDVVAGTFVGCSVGSLYRCLVGLCPN